MTVQPVLEDRLDEPFPSEDEQEPDTGPGLESDGDAEAEQDEVPAVLGSESTNIANTTAGVGLPGVPAIDNPQMPLQESLLEPTNPVPINEDAFLLDAAPT